MISFRVVGKSDISRISAVTDNFVFEVLAPSSGQELLCVDNLVVNKADLLTYVDLALYQVVVSVQLEATEKGKRFLGKAQVGEGG